MPTDDRDTDAAPEAHDAPAPAASARRVARLTAPVREFLQTEVAGGVVLLVATAVALAWANSPWKGGYAALWGTELTIDLGGRVLSEDLRHWVNDALMAVFFFVVGLEIKHELVAGELRDRRAAALPAIAALGGMVVPAALYALLNGGTEGADGWGVPMATDIAFALGVLALLGPRVPASVKVFLLTLAIVDDIGAIVVIAAFYSGGIEWAALGVAVALLAAVVVLRRAGVWWHPAYVVVGMGVWLATFQSGVHATIAGVAMGLLTPAHARSHRGPVFDRVRALFDASPSPPRARAASKALHETVPLTQTLQHLLHPLTSFVVVPLFALANAGIVLDVDAVADAASSRVSLGIVLGLVVGKLAGITGFSWLAVRLRVASLPAGSRWSHLVGASAVAGIGFTVAIFVAGLAFEDAAALEAEAKIGILAASLVASGVGLLVLSLATRRA